MGIEILHNITRKPVQCVVKQGLGEGLGIGPRDRAKTTTEWLNAGVAHRRESVFKVNRIVINNSILI